MIRNKVIGYICAILFTVNIYADTNNIVSMEDIVVTASRSEKDINKVPNIVYNVQTTGMNTQPKTTPNMLNGIPSVMVQKTSLGQGSPYIRGFTGFRTLCMIDGIRLNNSVFRDGPNQYWNTIDPLSINRYELVMGPGSVMYGSDAIGGTLNAITEDPPEYSSNTNTTKNKAYYRGSTAEHSNIGRLQIGDTLGENIGFIGGSSIKRFGDLKGGKRVGIQEHTGYDEQDYDLKANYFISDNTKLTLCHQTVEQVDVWRTHKTIYGIDWEGVEVGTDKVYSYDQNRHLTYMKFKSDNHYGVIKSLDANVSLHNQNEDMLRVKKDNSSEQQGFDVNTFGTGLQLESPSDLGNFVYGLEYYRDTVDSYSEKYNSNGTKTKTEIQGPVADDAIYDTIGIYVEDTISLFDEKLDVITGVRYNIVSVDANNVKDPITGKKMSIENNWESTVGSLKLVLPLSHNRDNILYGGVSEGYRAPNLSDLSRLDTARSNEIETPSPELDPEYYTSYEIGIKSRINKVVFQASYYYTTIDNMIVRTPTGKVIDGSKEVTKKNAGDGYVQGVELKETYLVTSEWSIWFGASWMDGKVDTYTTSTTKPEKDYISRLMPPTMQFGIKWEDISKKYWIAFVNNMATCADKISEDDKRDTQRIPDGGTPGYSVFNISSGVNPTKNTEVSLSLENILNEDYRIHGSGVNEPGRNLILTIVYNF